MERKIKLKRKEYPSYWLALVLGSPIILAVIIRDLLCLKNRFMKMNIWLNKEV